MKHVLKARATPRLTAGTPGDFPAELPEEKLKRRSRFRCDDPQALKRRLAQDLHDHAGQFIAALYLRLNILDRHLSSPDGRAQIEKMRCDLHRLGRELRLVALFGRPALLQRAGLAEAIIALLQEWTEVAGFAVEFHCNRPDVRLEPAVELALYRVTQEALTNVVKYAAASPKVSVTLQIDGTNWKCLKIEDQGPGFDPEDGDGEDGRRKSGLLGMQRRLRGIGGSLDVVSAPGLGTTILAWRQPMVPIRSRYHARPQGRVSRSTEIKKRI